MGDVFLHIAFARRIRTAPELHPLAVQASLRHASALTLGASLGFLPKLDTQKIGFFRRLFGGGATEDKWSTHFTGAEPKVDLTLALLDPSREDSPGSMLRLALAMGTLSSEILRAKIFPLLGNLDPTEQAATARALSRLWLQQAMPRLALLEREWAPGIALSEKTPNKRTLAALRAAAFVAYGSAPQSDQWVRWLKGLSGALAAAHGGLPSETSISTGSIEQHLFRDQNFVSLIDEAQTWAVYLFNRLAESMMNGEPERDQLRSLLLDASGTLRELPSHDALDGAIERHSSAMADLREEHAGRGRNDEAAFNEGGLLNELPPLPPLPSNEPTADATPPPLVPTIPPTDAAQANAAQADAAQADASQDSNAASSAPPAKTEFTAPANTQLVDEGAIEEMAPPANTPPAPPTPSAEAELAAAENDAAANAAQEMAAPPLPPAPPTSTQQISAADIEAEIASAESANAANAPISAPPPAPAPPAPSATQQISAADIEAEIASAESANAANAPISAPPPAPAPPAPTATQQISAADIEAEIASAESTNAANAPISAPPPAPAPPAPTATQQISAADIEAEIAEQGSAKES